MKKNNNTNKNWTVYLVYAAIALLIINFFLVFLPFAEVYQPAYKKTVMDQVTYEGWYTDRASMFTFIFPLLFVLPYSLEIGRFFRKKEKSTLAKMMNNTLEKPALFKGILIGAVGYLISMGYLFFKLWGKALVYEEYGAYCHFTAGGVINIIFTVALLAVISVLTYLSRRRFASVNQNNESEQQGEVVE